MSDSANVVRLDPDVQRHVRARIARLPAVAHAFYEEGVKALSELLVNYFEAVDDAMFERADQAQNNHEQNMYFDSMREVRIQRKSIEGRFVAVIEEAFARLAGHDNRDQMSESGELSAEALSLVQSEDLEQLVAMEDMVDKASYQLAGVLKELSAGLNQCVPIPVSAQKNPFGPNVVSVAAMSQIKRLDVEVKAKLLLFKLFENCVVANLPSVYRRLFAVLAEKGIEFDHTLIEAAVSLGSKPAEEEEVRETSSEQLIELLSLIQTLPSTIEASEEIDVVAELEKAQSRKKDELVLGSLEAETINLVQMLFKFVLENEELNVHTKEFFCRLQIPFVKLALMDSSFLAKPKHPARMLINELAQASLQWSCSQSTNQISKDPVYRVLKRTVDKIVLQFESNTEIFQETLQDFTAFMEKEARRAAVLEKRIIDAEAGKARAEEARAKIALEVKQHTEGRTLPAGVRTLIEGPWSNVLFVVGLKYGYGSTEWCDQVKVMVDLVHSVQPCKTKAARERLVILVPGLIANLRSGLDSISYNPFEVSELFKELEEVHLLRMRSELLPGEAEKPVEQTSEKQVGIADKNKETQIAEEHFSASKNEAGTVAKAIAEPQAKEKVNDPHLQAVSGFSQGTWFGFSKEIIEEEHQENMTGDLLRCRLAAIIKQTGKYIFVNRSGMKVAERTQTELAEALKAGQLKPLDNTQLFDRALENVVSGLRKPSSMGNLNA